MQKSLKLSHFLRSKKLVNFDSQKRFAHVSASSSFPTSATDSSGKNANKAWEKLITKKLHNEFVEEQARYSIELQRRSARNQVLSYIQQKRFFHLLSFASQYYLSTRARPNYPFDDELFAVVFKYIAAQCKDLKRNWQWMGSEESSTMFFNLAKFMNDLPLQGEDTKCAFALALQQITEWAELPTNHNRQDIRQIIQILNQKFRIMDYYTNLFQEQLRFEEQNTIKAKNFCRTSTLEPMEELIQKWGWKQAIEKNLKKKLMELGELELKSFLSGINLSACASNLVDCIQTAMCSGNNLVSLPEVKRSICKVILNMSRQSFLKSISCDRQKVFNHVFSDYLKYYTDEELARKYTIREWWSLCCLNNDLSENFNLPFSEFFKKPPIKLAAVLFSIITESCTFPSENPLFKKRSKAFSFHNVVLEEESSLLFGNEMKLEIYEMLSIHPKLMEYIEKHQFEYFFFSCDLLPLKIPPRPWIDYGECGPCYSRPQDILRNLYEFPHVNVNNEFSKRLYNRTQARPVFDALNDLGATPWTINKTMLENAKKAFSFSEDVNKENLLKSLSIPQHPKTVVVPDFAKTFGENANVLDIPLKKWREFSQRSFDNQKIKNEMNSLYCWLSYRLILATHYANDCLYFPHNMDFRGRVYPISPHLNHMGDDLNRGILKFARGKPLGKNGFKWLKLHCINITGQMKREPIHRRIELAEESIEDMLDSANNPFDGKCWWQNSDDPWQTLAACVEVRDAIESGNPETFVSHLPIHQDGSCNGLQHYAALGKDLQGAIEVNLVPKDTPQDLYLSVALRVEQKRIADEESKDEKIRELALELRKEMPQVLPRKVIKQTVMTVAYGVTMFGAVSQIKRQLKALDMNSDSCNKFASYLAKHTFASLDEAFESSMKLKEWLQKCARTTVKLLQPIQWITPLGMPIIQPYVYPEKKHDLLCLLPVGHKQVNAFPPNFVHSLDSTHMMLTTLSCRKRGITFAAVHDCYWTHACDVDEMNKICREQFIALHKQPIIEDFSKFLLKTYLSDEIRQALPQKELDKFLNVFTSKMEPGELNIEDVKDSVYFFS